MTQTNLLKLSIDTFDIPDIVFFPLFLEQTEENHVILF